MSIPSFKFTLARFNACVKLTHKYFKIKDGSAIRFSFTARFNKLCAYILSIASGTPCPVQSSTANNELSPDFSIQ